MTTVGFASLEIRPDFDGFGRNIERGSRPGLLSAGRSGGTLFGDTAGRSAGQRFGSVFKSAAKAGILGGLAVAAGAIKLGSDAIGEATESLKVGRQTAAVIKSTGGAARVSERDVSKLANQLSYMAGVDDELVQSSENVFLTFKGIRNEAGKNNRIFDRGTKAALNMSKALGTDLKGASIQVGKALNDPVKGITALQRVGVSFTNKQRAQIKALVEGGDANAAMALGLIDTTTTYNNLLKENGGNASKVAQILKSELTPEQKKSFDLYAEGGHTLEAQKRILRELGSEFGGSARSQATASDRMKVAFGNVEEALGKGLLPIVQDFSRFLLRKGVPAAEEFTDWFTNQGIPKVKELADKVRPLANSLLPAAADGFEAIKGFAEDALPFAKGIADTFNDMPDWVKKVLIGGAVGGLTAKKLGLTKLVTGGGAPGAGLFSKGSSPANPLNVFVVNNGFGDSRGGPGVLPGDGNPNSPRNRPTPRHLKGGAATDLAVLFGIPIAADLATDALGWQEATEKQHKKTVTFLDKWGEGVVDAANHARQKIADSFNVDIADNIGKSPFFNGIPGTDFFINGDAKKELSDALAGVSGPALLRLNDDLKSEFGVGIPKLVRLGMLDASAQVDLQLARQQDAVIRAAREKVQGFRASIEGDYTGRFTLLGIDKANLQINGMFDLFMARNRRLQGQFPAGGEGGPSQPPNHTPPTRSAPTSRGTTVIINGDVRPNDSKEFISTIQRRAISGSQDGWG